MSHKCQTCGSLENVQRFTNFKAFNGSLTKGRHKTSYICSKCIDIENKRKDRYTEMCNTMSEMVKEGKSAKEIIQFQTTFTQETQELYGF